MTTNAATCAYRIATDSDELGQRITAHTHDRIEICGAYRPARLNDWRIYLTKLIATETGLPQPHKAHVCSREDAQRWVETIAALYISASRIGDLL